MFKKILVCADGSACSLHAARIGASIASHTGAEVIVLNAFNAYYADAAYMGVWLATVDEESIDLCAKEQLDVVEKGVSPLFERRNIPCRLRQATGHPIDVILQTAEDEKVDLIVIGSRGISGFKEFVLGSVSNGVLNHAHCPVLIARGDDWPGQNLDFQHILLASDGSVCARKAAEVAVNLASSYATSLNILNVCTEEQSHNVVASRGSRVMVLEKPDYAERLLTLVKHNVSDFATTAGVYCTYTQEYGHPGERIINFANRSKTDLIVMGSRGLGGFERMLIGSISNHIAHHADCPVLIIR